MTREDILKNVGFWENEIVRLSLMEGEYIKKGKKPPAELINHRVAAVQNAIRWRGVYTSLPMGGR